mmetsp:Transcript_4278/g.13664  ORF Transcript_4278/g.13664 Transcript_4278/m.13664 type:complete len:82 (+) Transcript_4278:179-424(+)
MLEAYNGDVVLSQRHIENLFTIQVVTSFKTLTILETVTPNARVSLKTPEPQTPRILPKTDPPGEAFYETCALVASSGILMR